MNLKKEPVCSTIFNYSKEKPKPSGPFLDQSSFIDKTLLFGALPMQPYEAYSGLSLFKLPNDKEISDQLLAETDRFSRMTLDKLTSNERQTSPKKRNFSDLENMNHDDSTKDQSQMVIEEDKKRLERVYMKKDIWKNPNYLMETLENFHMKQDLKLQQRLDLVGINHWFFKEKTERAVIQELILLLNGIESEIFGINENGKFEIKELIQIKHISSQTLNSLLKDFLSIANNLLEIKQNLEDFISNFTTNVIEGMIESIKDYFTQYKAFLEDIQCIHVKQAAQVKLSNLDVKYEELKPYMTDRPITLIELQNLLHDYKINFKMILDITHNLLHTFRNALPNIERVARENISPQECQEIKPFISMITLSYLHRILSENIISSNSNETRIPIVKIFFKSVEPYLRILNKWLKYGTLEDKYTEFFIKHKNPTKIITNFYSKINWDEDFIVQKYNLKWKYLNDEKAFICIPSFLNKYAKNISDIGKTIKILCYLGNHEKIDLKYEKVKNFIIIMHKLSFSKRFYTNLLKSFGEYENSTEVHESEKKIPEIPDLSVKLETNKKDYTFGAKLREKKLKEKEGLKIEKENLLYNHLPKKFDTYKENPFLFPYSIKAFTIKQNIVTEEEEQKILALEIPKTENKPDKPRIIFHNKIFKNQNQELLNNFRIYFDNEIERAILSMDRYYSKVLVNLLFDHFNLMDYFNLFRTIFFMEKSAIYENFMKEALFKPKGFNLDSNSIRTNNLFREALLKLKHPRIKNISELFAISPEKNEEIYKFSMISNLQVIFKGHYPLDIIFDKDAIQIYNRIFKYILEIKRAKIALINDNVMMKRTSTKQFISKNLDSDSSFGDEDDKNMKELIETTEKNEKFNLLKRRFGLNQKELLHFVDNLEFFVGYSVIDEYTNKYQEIILKSGSILDIIGYVKEYLGKITEVCQIHNTDKDTLYQWLKQVLDSCWEFNGLYKRLEGLSSVDDEFIEKLDSIKDELEKLMENFYKVIKTIMKALYTYNQNKYNAPVKNFYHNLNFNNYYINDVGDYVGKQ